MRFERIDDAVSAVCDNVASLLLPSTRWPSSWIFEASAVPSPVPHNVMRMCVYVFYFRFYEFNLTLINEQYKITWLLCTCIHIYIYEHTPNIYMYMNEIVARTSQHMKIF